ncbi:Diaminopimelate epimerase [Chlamydia avium]|uniref:Diaminopimelate epimerase n=1 Tax=Chlamydia avium TaxID=1457141 RepID=A0ABN0MSP0_9CHLA|nr:bifunctional diaminopimelate epimerase/glutamate racemase [Chlamydia avium]EPP37785.1 diaminopimelate epimerase [Chlamydia psittaci 10_743_SC13]EPP38467.1 diaminopimelate epimerase [Chlamydia avium]VVT42548.1 Diaminopimelate epimerase [Chlamydia avium]
MASCSLLTTCKRFLYSGAGNRFILTTDTCLDQDHSFISILCQEKQVDGILYILPSLCSDARLVIFNADGSRPSMCGNGLRCAMVHVSTLVSKKRISIETDIGVYSGIVYSSQRVFVDMTLPQWNYCCHQLSHTVPGLPTKVFFIHTGVPHLVVFVDNLSEIPVHVWGQFLRYHEAFSPEGVNVNFVQYLSNRECCIRTYERGLERESLACGTGATAVALVVSKCYGWQRGKIAIRTWSDVILKVFLNHSRVYLEGPVEKEGEF